LFWWRKRNEGFEWRDYVRTTILVRREQRRQRVKDIHAAAAAHVKDAGKRGLDASVAGARGAGSGARSYAKQFAGASVSLAKRAGALALSAIAAGARGLATGVSTLATGVAALAQRAGEPLGPVLEPVLSVAREPKPSLALKIIAGLTALGALYRTWTFGFDTDAMIAAVIAAITAVVLALAYLTDPYRSRRSGPRWRDDLLSRLRETELTLPGDRRVSGTTAGASLLAIIAVFALGSAAVYYNAPSRIAAVMSAPTTTRPATTGALPEADPSKLEGRAVVVSGDTLRVAGTLIVLDGIEAPEATQYCQRTSGQHTSGKWRCGVAAKDALASLVRGRRISCDIVGDGEGAKRARCYSRSNDIAQQLVRDGNVFANGGFLSRYASYESEAQTDKIGLWAGNADRPQDYRDKRWEEATKAAPDGCPIKGRIRSGARTYVLPWSASYDSVKPSKAKGERWFCSETEAKAAGWSRAS
jgi:endonuclease YncB( thermonuclease family)